MKKGIIFDIDGTMWNSCVPVAEAWSLVTKPEMGLSFTNEDMRSVMGLPMDEISQRFFPKLTPEKRQEIADKCMENENRYLLNHPGEPYPDLLTTLLALKKDYSLAIVSNCQKGYIDAFLDSLSLRALFSDFLSWGDNHLPKGQNIALIIKRNSFEKALYVGDTENDEKETHLAKIPFVHAAYGFGEAKNPEGSINALNELPPLVEKLLA